ncbi:MAG: GNAT family N-acetyltransferase [Candidatus Binatia bacterium]
MSTAFDIRPYRAGDETSINAGFNEVFGCERSLAEWRWKFAPEEDGSYIVVGCDSNGEIIAHFCAMRLRCRIGDRVVQAGQTVDVFCKRQSSALAQRLYLRTAREFFAGFGAPGGASFVYGFPSERAMRLGQLRLNYADPTPVKVWRRQMPWSLGLGIGWPGWRRRFAAGAAIPAARVDRLWTRAAQRYPAVVVRDFAWVQRRYLSHPTQKYVFVPVEDSGELRAWGVFATSRRIAYWVDLFWDGEDERSLHKLDAIGVSIARLAGAASFELWLTGDDEAAAILQQWGWNRHEPPVSLLVSVVPFEPELDVQSLLANLYVTLGDSDHV